MLGPENVLRSAPLESTCHIVQFASKSCPFKSQPLLPASRIYTSFLLRQSQFLKAGSIRDQKSAVLLLADRTLPSCFPDRRSRRIRRRPGLPVQGWQQWDNYHLYSKRRHHQCPATQGWVRLNSSPQHRTPNELHPVATTVPSAFNPTVCPAPADTCAMLVHALTLH